MRAQTTLDFAIGVTLFIAVLLFAFTFVPGILEPFDISGEEEPVLSDRVASRLSGEMLGSPENPNVLDRFCTVEFFDGNDPAECAFDGSTLREQLDLDATQNVNVTLEGDVSGSTTGNVGLCWRTDGISEPTLAEQSDCTSSDVSLAIGDEPTPGTTTITARRVVSLENEPVVLKVVVW